MQMLPKWHLLLSSKFKKKESSKQKPKTRKPYPENQKPNTGHTKIFDLFARDYIYIIFNKKMVFDELENN